MSHPALTKACYCGVDVTNLVSNIIILPSGPKPVDSRECSTRAVLHTCVHDRAYSNARHTRLGQRYEPLRAQDCRARHTKTIQVIL